MHLSAKNPAAGGEHGAARRIVLATGNPALQASGWRLIGDAYRARGATRMRLEAYQKANAVSAALMPALSG